MNKIKIILISNLDCLLYFEVISTTVQQGQITQKQFLCLMVVLKKKKKIKLRPATVISF